MALMTTQSVVSFDAPSMYEPPIVEWVLIQNRAHFFSCLFCSWSAGASEGVSSLMHSEALRHARVSHYWYNADRYLNSADMAAAKEQRRRYRSVMGEFNSDEDGPQVARAMNREGL